MKHALIAGIGNVLLGDDGIGPYVVELLGSQYEFSDDVELADLGTPALDLTHRIAGRDAVIFVDCVETDEHPPGTVLLYRREDILRTRPEQRLDPHSPALSECLLMAEMLGASPQHVLLVGVVGGEFEPGCRLSAAVREAVEAAIRAVLGELRRLGYGVEQKKLAGDLGIWWDDASVLPLAQ